MFKKYMFYLPCGNITPGIPLYLSLNNTVFLTYIYCDVKYWKRRYPSLVQGMDIFFSNILHHNRYMLETLYCSNWDKEVCLGLCCHRVNKTYISWTSISFIYFWIKISVSLNRIQNYIHLRKHETKKSYNYGAAVCVLF